MEFTCFWIVVYEWYFDRENKAHFLIDLIYPIAFIFELLVFVIVWTQGPFVGFMDLNLKSLRVVGSQCTIVELKNTMSGTLFLVNSLLCGYVTFLIYIMILVTSKYFSLTLVH